MKETLKRDLESVKWFYDFKSDKEALNFLRDSHRNEIESLKKDIETAERDFELLRTGHKVYLLETSCNHLNLLDSYIRKQKIALQDLINKY